MPLRISLNQDYAIVGGDKFVAQTRKWLDGRGLTGSTVIRSGNYDDASTILKACKPRVILLEYETRLGPAFQLMDLCRQEKLHVILVTQGKQPVFRALRYYIFDILSMPVDANRVYDTVKRALNTRPVSIRERFQRSCEECRGPELSHVYIPECTVSRFVRLMRIIRIRRVGAGTLVYLTGGQTIRSAKSMRYFAVCLPREQFRLTNRDLLVNSAYVLQNEPGKPLIMSDDFGFNEESFGELYGS